MPGMTLTQVKDPVCGMAVDPDTAPHRYAWQEETYYFCCEACEQKFQANPQGALDRAANAM